MAGVWQCLEGIRGQVGVPALWRAGLGDRFDGFCKNFLGKRAGRAESYPCPRECGCAHELVPRGDGLLVAVCACDPPCCDDFTVAPGEAVLWELNWRKLGVALCGVLKSDVRDTDLGVAGARQVGAFSSAAVPVVLSVQEGRRDFQAAVAGVIAALGKRFILLAPTSRFVDGWVLGRLTGAGARFFDLESHVAVMASGALQALKDPMELFAPLLAGAREPEPEDVARRLFALVEELESEGKWRKAPVIQVFRLYCLKGFSRAEVAKRCGCVPGLITLRLKTIEKRLGRKAAELRVLSPQFEEIEDSLSDSRARHIYRKGAVYGGEGEEYGGD